MYERCRNPSTGRALEQAARRSGAATKRRTLSLSRRQSLVRRHVGIADAVHLADAEVAVAVVAGAAGFDGSVGRGPGVQRRVTGGVVAVVAAEADARRRR